MYLHSLGLTNFKNYKSISHEFSENLNLITGANGTGKTNLLDAIHYLCNTKSAFLSSDSLAIKHEHDFFRIEGHFKEEGKNIKIECISQNGIGKTFLIEGKHPDKLANHVGRFPLVIVSPYDTDLIREGSDIRRKFFDLILSQSNSEYLNKLISYNRLLKQRNAALKQLAETRKSNPSLLQSYDQQLLPINFYIAKTRSTFIENFTPKIENAYQKLVERDEKPNIKYQTVVEEKEIFETIFLQNQTQDIAAQRTMLGIHTDDYEFSFNNSSLKRYGSQGQQKTFVLALKLAHFEFIQNVNGKKSILMLDDIFDRLDAERVSNLSKMIINKEFGQVFITDTSSNRTNILFNEISRNNINEINTYC